MKEKFLSQNDKFLLSSASLKIWFRALLLLHLTRFLNSPKFLIKLVPDSAPAQDSNPSPLRISLFTSQRPSYVDPSAAKSPSPHHSDSVIYGDEVLYVEDELKYPYPREPLQLFSIDAGVKGPPFTRNTHLVFFRESPYSKPRTSESP